MIDKIRIYVRQAVHRDMLAKSQYIRKIASNTFLLYNVQRDHQLIITVTCNGTIIEGSWRKWYFGADSLKDLTPNEALRVLVKICVETKLDIRAMLGARLLTMEFGANFFLPIYASTIVKSMFRYSTFVTGKYETSVSFRGCDYWLSAYDKMAEINKRKRDRRELENQNNANVLRIEMKVIKSTAFRNKMRGIETVRDVFRCYRLLISSFLNEIKKIDMSPINLVTDNVNFAGGNKKDLRQYLMYHGMTQIGAEQTFKYIKALDINKGAKTELRKEIKKIFAEYEAQSPYHKSDFIDDVIRRQLAKKMNERIPRV